MRRTVSHLLLSIPWGPRFQSLFEAAFGTLLVMMNYGSAERTAERDEGYVLDHIDRSLRTKIIEPFVIFDVGANVGTYSSLVDSHFQNRAAIRCFEPNPEAFRQLQANVGDRRNVVDMRQVAVGDEHGVMSIHIPSASASSSIASHYRDALDRFMVDSVKTVEVPVLTLDEYCEENNIDHIHLLKIDVEGHELAVLRGASRMLAAGRIDFIQFEFGSPAISARAFMRDFFRLLGSEYRMYRVVQRGLYRMRRYREVYEIFFRTTNYVAARERLISL